MSQPTAYEILLRGQPSHRLLRPLADDFTVEALADGTTRLAGSVGDPAHLHGIVAHLTSVNVEIISIAPGTSTSNDDPNEGTNMTTTHVTESADASTETSATPLMQALAQYRYGTAEVLVLDRLDVPTPGRDEVLVKVVAAGIDRGTCHLMTGTPYLIRVAGFGLTRPKQHVVGLDVAGRVVAVGSDVTRFVPGDAVFGIADGSLAEFAVAKEDKLAAKPDGLPFDQAAVSAVSGIAALQALTDVGRVESGQRVLVIGASGGVGSFAVQLAKALGTEVHAVASTRNLEFMRTLGADRVIDYTAQDLTDLDEQYDLVIDIGGRNSIRRLRSVLMPKGVLVIVGGEDGNRFTGGIGRQVRAMMLSPLVSQRLTMFISTEHHSYMERLADHIEAGSVTPAVQARVPLADAAAAIGQLDSGRATGKTAVIVNDAGADR